MTVLTGLTDQQVAEQAREDFRAAKISRQQIEERKLRDYRLYRRFRRKLPGGGIQVESRGPTGWSKLTIPLVFWVVETILPRLGVDPPTLIVNAENPAAVPFAEAKQLRLQHHIKRARMEEEMLLSLKQFLILGDAPIKTPWDAYLGGPRALAINWFDWFVSPDAMRWHEAEVLFHRSWHTRRDIERLGQRRDDDGRAIYDAAALERLLGSSQREAQDSTWNSVREAGGLGPATFPDNEGQIALVECWYRDGSMCVISGDDQAILVRRVDDPLLREPSPDPDQPGRPFRPFAVLQNTPDLFLPYSISDAEMQEDHQEELSTLRNQKIDQLSRDINAPTGIDRAKADPAEVRAAFAVPGGQFFTDGPPQEAVWRYPPGQGSGDLDRFYDQIRNESQMIAGISDISAAVETPGGLSNNTATGASIFREESNWRYRMKLKLVTMGLQRLACNFDWMDRLIGGRALSVQVDQGYAPPAEARGITMISDRFARVSTSANAPGLEYALEIDAGSMAPPGQMEQAQKLRGLLQDLANPAFSGLVNIPELARMLVEANGYAPERVLNPPEVVQQQQMAAAQANGAPPARYPGAPANGGPIPVGPPVPLDGGPPHPAMVGRG